MKQNQSGIHNGKCHLRETTSREKVFNIIDNPKDGSRASAIFDWFLMILILLNTTAVIASSVGDIHEKYKKLFTCFEYFSVSVFTIEYLLRLWTAPCKFPKPEIKTPYRKYIFSFLGIVDLCAILPFFLQFAFKIDLRMLRILRLFRLLRVLKLVRYNDALNLIIKVLKNEKEKLYITVFFMCLLILLSSSFMYFIEHEVQPEHFPNIPATLWWAVASLTTVGYGDVYPVTVPGKLLGGIISVMGIGLVAMPSGIISMGLIEEVKKRRKKLKKKRAEITTVELVVFEGHKLAESISGVPLQALYVPREYLFRARWGRQ